jgi:DNA-3-methyladenine glycosylase I
LGKPDYVHYHDTEWGVPVHDDAALFALLVLEAAQAGLSWYTVLQRRHAYYEAFHGLVPGPCAAMTDAELEALCSHRAIIRHRAKIFSVRTNARVFLAIQAAYGTFDHYIWGFVGHRPIINRPTSLAEVPARTPLSDAMAKDLRARGMTFVGSTILYAYMQAIGMVNDHMTCCFLAPTS